MKEYKMLNVKFGESESILNEYAAKGWILKQISFDNYVSIVMERDKEGQDENIGKKDPIGALFTNLP